MKAGQQARLTDPQFDGSRLPGAGVGSGRSSKPQLVATPPRKSRPVRLAPDPPPGGILTSAPSTAPTKPRVFFFLRDKGLRNSVLEKPHQKPLEERAPSAAGSRRQLPGQPSTSGSPGPAPRGAPSAPGTASAKAADGAQHPVLSTRCPSGQQPC